MSVTKSIPKKTISELEEAKAYFKKKGYTVIAGSNRIDMAPIPTFKTKSTDLCLSRWYFSIGTEGTPYCCGTSELGGFSYNDPQNVLKSDAAKEHMIILMKEVLRRKMALVQESDSKGLVFATVVRQEILNDIDEDYSDSEYEPDLLNYIDEQPLSSYIMENAFIQSGFKSVGDFVNPNSGNILRSYVKVLTPLK